MEKKLTEAFVNLEEHETLETVRQMLQDGKDALEIIENCRNGIQIIGEKYYYGIYYLSDLIVAGEMFRSIINILELDAPEFSCLDSFAAENKPKVIIGTIHGDIHNLGKDIMIFVLRSSGFQVYDLGVNVPPEEFVKAIGQTGARVLGVSVLLTFCFNEVKKLVELLKETGLREKVKVIVGGYPVNEAFREYVGADYCGGDAVSSLDVFNKAFTELDGF